MAGRGLTNPVIIQRTYDESDPEVLQIKAAADLGPLFLDGFGDAIRIENLNPAILQSEIDALSLDILQTARVRISKPEYIACPSCGRTLYNIEKTLAAIKARTGHLVGVKIGVMGCIVNGTRRNGRRRLRLRRLRPRTDHAVQRPRSGTPQHPRRAGHRRAARTDRRSRKWNVDSPYFFCGSKTLNKSAALRRAACFTLSAKDFILSGNFTVEQFDTPVEPADFAAQFGF